jgi:mannose-1-phosphate guanylyltransferase
MEVEHAMTGLDARPCTRSGEARAPRNTTGSRTDDCWAVILAGGEGTRLLPLTRVLAGDERPKQFCALLGQETLLESTRKRVALSVQSSRTLFILTKSHDRYYEPLIADVPRRQLVEQPSNAGTAAAILYGLLRLRKEDPSGLVAFFPTDHYVSDDRAFMGHVERAVAATRARRDLVILIGIPPESPEPEYGWIEPTAPSSMEDSGGVRWIRRFWEKPAFPLARTLMKRGCLWNSFVMVGTVAAFIDLIREAAPDLYGGFESIEATFGSNDEEQAVRELYEVLSETNFSRDVLTARPANIGVLVADGVNWSDLGRPDRALARMQAAAGGDARFDRGRPAATYADVIG